MKNNKGFTLIELMLVIAIIGMLAAIAIPAFIGQRVKAKQQEGNILAGDIRKDVQEFYWHTGRFPANNAEAGLPEPENIKGNYVKSITVRDGVIETLIDVGDGDKTAALHPVIIANDPTAMVQWWSWCGDETEGLIVMGCDKGSNPEEQ